MNTPRTLVRERGRIHPGSGPPGNCCAFAGSAFFL
jgi:hypothetical protein